MPSQLKKRRPSVRSMANGLVSFLPPDHTCPHGSVHCMACMRYHLVCMCYGLHVLRSADAQGPRRCVNVFMSVYGSALGFNERTNHSPCSCLTSTQGYNFWEAHVKPVRLTQGGSINRPLRSACVMVCMFYGLHVVSMCYGLHVLHACVMLSTIMVYVCNGP